jgi:hypothetical protein
MWSLERDRGLGNHCGAPRGILRPRGSQSRQISQPGKRKINITRWQIAQGRGQHSRLSGGGQV